MSIWERYEKGKKHADKTSLIKNTKEQWNFYLGKQWEGLKTDGEEMAVFNIIEQTIKYKVSTICRNKITAHYSGNEDVELFRILDKKFSDKWEKGKMDTKVWKAVKGSAIAGDSYTFYGTGDISDCQILSNTSVMLGDEEEEDLQAQPYILILERLPIKTIKEMAEKNKVSAEVTEDSNDDHLLNDGADNDGKALVVMCLEKIDGVVHIGRATELYEIEPMRPLKPTLDGEYVGKGLRQYPIVGFRWEDIPDSARGQGEVRKLIPNQIQVNKILALRTISAKEFAFPKMAYYVDALANPEELKKFGGRIELNADSARSVSQVVSYLQPMSASNDASHLTSEIMGTTKELAGASDTTLGQIDPTRVSNATVMSLKDSSEVNLNEQISKFAQYVEDTARLWYEMDTIYEGDITLESGDVIPVEKLEELEPDIRVDVTEDTPYTKEMLMTSLEKLRDQGDKLSLAEFTELLPDNTPFPKEKLSNLLKQRKVETDEVQNMQQGIVD